MMSLQHFLATHRRRTTDEISAVYREHGTPCYQCPAVCYCRESLHLDVVYAVRAAVMGPDGRLSSYKVCYGWAPKPEYDDKEI